MPSAAQTTVSTIIPLLQNIRNNNNELNGPVSRTVQVNHFQKKYRYESKSQAAE